MRDTNPFPKKGETDEHLRDTTDQKRDGDCLGKLRGDLVVKQSSNDQFILCGNRGIAGVVQPGEINGKLGHVFSYSDDFDNRSNHRVSDWSSSNSQDQELADEKTSASLHAPLSQAGFDAGVQPVGGKTKSRKKRELLRLPTGGQDDLKSLMPILPTGYWFECPADDKGFKIKLRWRVGKSKDSHVFQRVGKTEFQTLKGYSDEKRKWFIADRLRGELIRKGKREFARRISLIPSDD